MEDRKGWERVDRGEVERKVRGRECSEYLKGIDCEERKEGDLPLDVMLNVVYVYV